MNRRVLMVAFNYPPSRGSSGVQRTLSFSRYLRDHGWDPIVLSADPCAYAETSDDQMSWIPEGMIVERPFARDAARHFALNGKYLGWTALPDRWVSWLLGAVPAGLRLIRRYRPEVLWTTQPTRTAHLIGMILHRLTGIPWISDFRDPMTTEGHPADPVERMICRWIERRTVTASARVVFTTPGAVRTYAGCYPALPGDKWRLIPNGYDERVFREAGQDLQPRRQGPFVLVHSGVLPSERDPRALFRALAALKREGRVCADTLRVVLRATRHDGLYRPMLAAYEIEDLVLLEPAIAYRDAVREMLQADGLLLLQGSSFNDQVPAKIYEYFRCGQPILALTDPAGESAATLQEAGSGMIVPLDREERIREAIPAFLAAARSGDGTDAATAASYSRETQTGLLARLLDEVAGA